MSLLLLPPILLVVGTTLLVTMAGCTMQDAKTAALSAKRAFTANAETAKNLVPQVVELAEMARREGLLALEESAKQVDDEFLRRGITMAVDGTDLEELREILEHIGRDHHTKAQSDPDRWRWVHHSTLDARRPVGAALTGPTRRP